MSTGVVCEHWCGACVQYESWRARFYLAGDEELMEEETVSILEPEITVHSCGFCVCSNHYGCG